MTMPLFPANTNLSSLNGSNGFRLLGAAASDTSGYSVASAGDINGDGFADVIIGARYGSASYVVFGKAGGFASNINLSSLNGTTGFKLSGTTATTVGGNRAGWSVDSAGDVNGDGLDDLIIGAPYTDAPGLASGASYVVFGKTGGFASNINLSSLDGNTGFRLSGAASLDRSGKSVASAGDVNGDGFDDLIVGARHASPHGSESGASYVVFGKAGGFASNIGLSSLNGTTGFKLSGAAAYDKSGRSVASAGDVNGDGFADLIVGAYDADPNGNSSGASYVVFGKASGFASNIDLSSLNGTTGFKLSGAAANDRSGRSVASAGDVNGDGFDDLIIGARDATPNGNGSGASYVVFGKASGFASNIALSSLDGTTGFKLSGAAFDGSGASVAAAGDVNGDGFADLIVGAPFADPNGGTDKGATYVVFGKASGFASNINLSSLDGSAGFKISGVELDGRSGWSVSSAGDVNGDGFADLIVGAPYADANGVNSGVSYVIFGHATPPSAPADGDGTVNRIAEGAAAGTAVGITATSTGTIGRTLTYSLTDSANGAFQIDPVTGVVSVADASKIDYETAPGHAYGIVVRASDSAGELSLTSSFMIDVAATNAVAPVITTAADQTVAENSTLVAELTSTDPDPVGTNPAIFTITGGLDASLFEIVDGDLLFKAAKDFEVDPHTYEVKVTASDGANTSSKTITVNLTDTNDAAPVITTAADQTVAENSTLVAELTSTDPDSLGTNPAIFTITGGLDASLFEIVDGDLVFNAAKDFEVDPLTYQVEVSAFDGVHTSSQLVTVHLADVLGATIVGTSAADTVDAGVAPAGQPLPTGEQDTIAGLGHDDILHGLGGNDIVRGGGGNDTLYGDEGKDRLVGGAGDDTLIGGASRDVMTGGDGADRFVIGALSDSVTGGGRDLIKDFLIGSDQIDVTAIDADAGTASDQAFTYIGAGAFTHTAGELQAKAFGDKTLVSGDVDGNGKADFQILLSGSVALQATDFLL
jgi:hypothetical protein